MPGLRRPTNDQWVPMLEVGPFGGIDPTTQNYYVQQTNFVDMVNILPNKGYGGYVTTQGRSNLLLSNIPGRIRGIQKFSRPGIPNGYIVATDIGTFSGHGELYYVEAGGTPVLLTLPAGASLTFGAQYSMETSQQWCFIVNGVDTPLKVDQNLIVTYWGIVTPTTAPTLLAAGSSTMVGTYHYAVTFGNSIQESSQGAVSLPITVFNQGVALTLIPTSSDPQVTQRNIYRLGGTSGIWSLIHTINDNITTTYVDTTADTAVGHSLTVFRDPPPNFVYITSHNSAIWGLVTVNHITTVWASNVNEPWGFNSELGNWPVSNGSLNSEARGLSEVGSVLAVHMSDALFAVFGNEQANYIVQFIEYTGCTSANSIISAYGSTWWKSKQGYYTWGGSGYSTNLSDGAFQKSNIKQILDNLSFEDDSLSRSVVFDRMIGISFPTLNTTYFWDLRTQAWFPVGFAADQAYSDLNGSIPLIGQNLFVNGEIDQWFSQDTDLGEPITAWITSGVTDSGQINAEKEYRFVQVQGAPQNAELSIQTTVNPGSNAYHDVRSVSMASGGPVYQFSLPMTMKGREVQLKILVTTSFQVQIQKAAILGEVVRYNIQNDV